MSRHVIRRGRFESAEVKEAKRLSVDEKRVAVASRDAPLLKIPVRDVVAVVAERDDAIKQTRHEIDPFLIDEESVLRIDDAVVFEPPFPPFEKRIELRVARDGDEAEV